MPDKKMGGNTKKGEKAGKAAKNKSPAPKPGKKGESSKHGKDPRVVEIYCAIYRPQSGVGNYYHWALAIYHIGKKRWQIFQVVQDESEGPYKRDERQVDPKLSSTCLQPLTLLGLMSADYWDWLIKAARNIPVPGQAPSWNCQDHVLEIWALLLKKGAIDDTTWSHGHGLVLPYYGPDYGGQERDHTDEYEEEEAEEEDDGGRKVLSEEFVYDSDSC
ncbi:hypothetical protein E4U35_006549 [Claviceps purpurea]|nr:hypothetical protein E4U35_006549 [Claviceps purpurea]KAG6213801.1 hypothetical protein E4U34_006512 [Claviceps purpurea]KAG6262111.1 hypothetical protein E4U49_003363 [Claviceps purpurea]